MAPGWTAGPGVSMVGGMGMLDRDFIHREIRRLAQAVARILGLGPAHADLALEQLKQEQDQLSGGLTDLLKRSGADTVARLLVDPNVLAGWALLAAVEALVLARAGWPQASAQAAQALALMDVVPPPLPSDLAELSHALHGVVQGSRTVG